MALTQRSVESCTELFLEYGFGNRRELKCFSQLNEVRGANADLTDKLQNIRIHNESTEEVTRSRCGAVCW